MRNFIIAVTAFATLNSCRLLSQRNEKRVYKALTANERIAVSQGNSIEKIDTIKRKSNLEFGPITVNTIGKSMVVKEHGVWMFYISGCLFNRNDFDNGIMSIYHRNGQISSTSYDLSKSEKSGLPVPGEIIEKRIVHFRNGNIFDTAYVFHFFNRINEQGKQKPIRAKDFISDGWNGVKAAPRR